MAALHLSFEANRINTATNYAADNVQEGRRGTKNFQAF